MPYLNVESIVNKILSPEVESVMVPTNIFGRKVFVRSTKEDLVRQIRKEFADNRDSRLKVRVFKNSKVATVELADPVRQATPPAAPAPKAATEAPKPAKPVKKAAPAPAPAPVKAPAGKANPKAKGFDPRETQGQTKRGKRAEMA